MWIPILVIWNLYFEIVLWITWIYGRHTRPPFSAHPWQQSGFTWQRKATSAFQINNLFHTITGSINLSIWNHHPAVRFNVDRTSIYEHIPQKTVGSHLLSSSTPGAQTSANVYFWNVNNYRQGWNIPSKNTRITAGMNNSVHYKVLDEIIYPFPNHYWSLGMEK